MREFQGVLRKARRNQEEPGGARRNQGKPGGAGGARGRPGEGLEGPGVLKRARGAPLAILGSLGLLALPMAFPWTPWQSIELPQQLACLCREHPTGGNLERNTCHTSSLKLPSFPFFYWVFFQLLSLFHHSHILAISATARPLRDGGSGKPLKML